MKLFRSFQAWALVVLSLFSFIGTPLVAQALLATDLSGIVFFDGNQDGVYSNPVDVLLLGVTVELYDAESVIQTVKTDAQGQYLFSGLGAGDYTVQVNFAQSVADLSLDGAAQKTTASSYAVTVDGSVTATTVPGMGYFWDLTQVAGTTTVQGSVYFDADQSATFNPQGGDLIIPAVTVDLKDLNGQVIQTVQTDSQGIYTFNNVLSGSYQVVVNETTIDGATSLGLTPALTTANSPQLLTALTGFNTNTNGIGYFWSLGSGTQTGGNGGGPGGQPPASVLLTTGGSSGGGQPTPGNPTSPTTGGGGGGNVGPNGQPIDQQPIPEVTPTTTPGELLHQVCSIDGYKITMGKAFALFMPFARMTRGELITILMQCKYGKLSTVKSYAFPDIHGDEAAPYIMKAYEDGVVIGYIDGLFRSTKDVTLAEALKMIQLTLNKKEEIEAAPVSNECKDVDQTEWYAKYFNFDAFTGVINVRANVNGDCGPQDPLGRQSTASWVVKAFGL